MDPKVVAGGGGVGITGAVTTVVIWVLTTKFHVEIPAEIGAAIATIVTFLGSLVGGYITPRGPTS
jgi:hypothetical protein